MNDKTVFVFGAGSTAALGMPTTEEQIELLRKIDKTEDDDLCKLFNILNGVFGERKYQLNDIFNIIDSNLILQKALQYKYEKIEAYELAEYKRKLITYIFENFLESLKNKDDGIYQKYIDFYASLAKNELLGKLDCGLDCTDKDFFISSFSIINFNWDLYSLLPIIEAHKVVNHGNDLYFKKWRNPRLKIYTDFNCEYACAEVEDKLWYPFTEPAAFALNGEKHDATKRVVLLKCFYPHGAMNFFKCSGCAKHSFYLGNLTLNDVIEKIDYESNSFLYKCPYCGKEIHSKDFDILSQSNFKVRNSFLEEIRLSMTQELRTADTIVFVGYSMPNDDVDYKTMFKTLNSNAKKVYVVLFDNESPNEFISYSELNAKAKETVRNFDEVFAEKAKYNMSGAPNAFNELLKVLEIDV